MFARRRTPPTPRQPVYNRAASPPNGNLVAFAQQATGESLDSIPESDRSQLTPAPSRF